MFHCPAVWPSMFASTVSFERTHLATISQIRGRTNDRRQVISASTWRFQSYREDRDSDIFTDGRNSPRTRLRRCNRQQKKILEVCIGLDHLSHFVISGGNPGASRVSRNWLAGLARGEVLVVWEDDDIYVYWHITAHVKALTDGRFSKPSRVLRHYTGMLREEEVAGRFHTSVAFT